MPCGPGAELTLRGAGARPIALRIALRSGEVTAVTVTLPDPDPALPAEPAVLVGHSLGGLLAQMLAARHPVRALVLLAPAAPAGILPSTPEETQAAAEKARLEEAAQQEAARAEAERKAAADKAAIEKARQAAAAEKAAADKAKAEASGGDDAKEETPPAKS